jgi:hypothetical protein
MCLTFWVNSVAIQVVFLTRDGFGVVEKARMKEKIRGDPIGIYGALSELSGTQLNPKHMPI